MAVYAYHAHQMGTYTDVSVAKITSTLLAKIQTVGGKNVAATAATATAAARLLLLLLGFLYTTQSILHMCVYISC